MPKPMIATASILLGIACTSFVSASLVQSIESRTDMIDADSDSILPQKNGFDFPHVENELIVRFRPEVPLQEREALFGQVKGHAKYSYKLVSDLYCIELEGSARDAFEMIKDRGDILMYAEPAYLMETFETPNDPSYTAMYGLSQVNASEAWETTTGLATTRIAIIDSGMDMDHPDLVGISSNPQKAPLRTGSMRMEMDSLMTSADGTSSRTTTIRTTKTVMGRTPAVPSGPSETTASESSA